MCTLHIKFTWDKTKILPNTSKFSLVNKEDHVYLDVTWIGWDGIEYRSFIDFDVIDGIIIYRKEKEENEI